MQIHVVQPGNTLAAIAATYNTTTTALIDANELDAPETLVVGQALVVPIAGRFHFVQPGESLYSIAQQYNTTYQELAQVNNIPVNQTLQVGFRLYIPEQPQPPITSNAYIEPLGDTVSQTLENAAAKNTPYLTYLALFSYNVNRDGTLEAPPLAICCKSPSKIIPR